MIQSAGSAVSPVFAEVAFAVAEVELFAGVAVTLLRVVVDVPEPLTAFGVVVNFGVVVGVAVGVSVGETVGVGVGVSVGETVGVGVGVSVGETGGVSVGVMVGVGVASAMVRFSVTFNVSAPL